MNFKHVGSAHLKSQDPKEVATQIFDFFLWQYKEALQDEINARVGHDACIAANHAAKTEWDRDESSLGWGPKLPYEQHYLDARLKEAEEAKLNLMDAKALLNFIRDRLVDKFVENDRPTNS